MPFTQTDIDALDSAFKTGAQSVSFQDGSSTTWRSVDEYLKLRSYMVDAVTQPDQSQAIRCTFASYHRD